MSTVIRSKRSMLLLQAALALLLAGFAGWMAQSWRVLQSSPLGKLSVQTGVPVIAVAVWGLAVILIGTIVLDNWNFRIEFCPDHMLISDRLGSTRVHYDNIERSKRVAYYGAGIVLKDAAKWLASFEGKQSGFDKLCKTSGLLKASYDCDLCIKSVRLNVGVERFLALVDERAMRSGDLVGSGR